jgi:osmotically-inducible protein OsmY
MSDLALRQRILDELEWEPSVEAAHIGVAVDKGVATLTGHVSSYAEKLAAERAVSRVKGVTAIAENIEIRYPAAKRTADDQIAKRAVDIINWQVSVPSDRIKVKVEKGWVTLSGEVDWYFQKTDAEKSVRRLSGVMGIANLITLKPRIEARDVKMRIEEALKRNAEIEAQNIRVYVQGGKVTLDGKVDSWAERQRVENTVWNAPGVVSVDDRLSVG